MIDKIIYTVLLLFVVNLEAVYAQSNVILFEDFESVSGGNIPQGWTKLQENGAEGWITGSNLGSGYFLVPNHTKYAASNDDDCNCNSVDNMLITPILDLSGKDVAFLTFDRYYTGRYGDDFLIKVTTDGGANWTIIKRITPNEDWTKEFVDLSQYCGNNNVMIAFYYSDNGLWASGSAIDNVGVYVPVSCDVNVWIKRFYPFVYKGDARTVSFCFTNMGIDTIHDFKSILYKDGVFVDSINLTNVNCGLLDTVTINRNIVIDDYDTHKFVWEVVAANGVAIRDTAYFSLAGIESGGSVAVLAEENTATWCGYCPEGDYMLSSLKNEYGDRFMPVSVHYSDIMQINDGGGLIKHFFSAYPSAMFNRWKFASSDFVPLVNYWQWGDAVSDLLACPSPFYIHIDGDFDNENRYYSAHVSFVPMGNLIGDFSVNLIVVEDSLECDNDSYYQANAYNEVSSSHFYGRGDTITDYMHRYVLRYMSGGIWGYDGLLPDTLIKGEEQSADFLVIVPNEWNESHLKVYAVVEFTGANSVYDRFLVGGKVADVMLNNQDVENSRFVEVFPEPAMDWIVFRANVSIAEYEIYDMWGHLLKDEIVGSKSQKIYINDFPTGIYLLKLKDVEGNILVKKIIKK